MLQWYDNLSSARGIQTPKDIERLTEEFSPGYRRLLSDILPAEKNAVIYDVGCGPGLTLNILKSLGYTSLEGTDLSGEAIQIARSVGLNARQADSIADLENKTDGSIDCIFAVDIIEHLEKSDLLRLLGIARAKLRPGGTLILRCPNGDSPLVGRHLFNDITHVWTYTSTALSVIFSMKGYRGVGFRDEAIAFANKKRIIKVPMMIIGQSILRILFKLATRESVTFLSPSFWTIART